MFDIVGHHRQHRSDKEESEASVVKCGKREFVSRSSPDNLYRGARHDPHYRKNFGAAE
jgi:hypothetical protein